MEVKEYKFKELKTYQVINKNYFYEKLDLENFVKEIEDKYIEIISSDNSLKILLRETGRLRTNSIFKAEINFKEIVREEFSYIVNFLNALNRIYVKKLDKKLFKIYANKESKEYFFYNLIYKEIEYKNINSLEVIEFFIENFKLDFGNLGSAGLFINNQLKYCNSVKLERLSK